MITSKNNKTAQSREKSDNKSKLRRDGTERPDKEQNHFELPEEIFRGMFFVDEQYQDRSGAGWQLWG